MYHKINISNNSIDIEESGTGDVMQQGIGIFMIRRTGMW